MKPIISLRFFAVLFISLFGIFVVANCDNKDSSPAAQGGKVYRTGDKGKTWGEIIQVPPDFNGMPSVITHLYFNDFGWLIILDHIPGYS